MAVKPVPDGHHTVTPYMTVRGVADLIEFLKKAFDATVLFQMKGPGGAIGHAEVKIGDSILMLGEARGEWQPMPAVLYLYLADCDTAYRKALEAGAESIQPLTNQFYGDRSGGVKDKHGNMWWVATHIEDVSEEEMHKRMAAMGK
jgi:PhnB protein